MPTNLWVDSEPDPTLDQLQDFIDECKSHGMSGDTKTRQIGKNEGYHFTGTYKFTPNGKVRAGAYEEQSNVARGPS